MKFNINNYATVTLTEYGAKVYNARYDDIREFYPKSIKIPTPVAEGFVLKAQVWTLFQTFGEHMHLGGVNPFESCIMTFDMKDFEE